MRPRDAIHQESTKATQHFVKTQELRGLGGDINEVQLCGVDSALLVVRKLGSDLSQETLVWWRCSFAVV